MLTQPSWPFNATLYSLDTNEGNSWTRYFYMTSFMTFCDVLWRGRQTPPILSQSNDIWLATIVCVVPWIDKVIVKKCHFVMSYHVITKVRMGVWCHQKDLYSVVLTTSLIIHITQYRSEFQFCWLRKVNKIEIQFCWLWKSTKLKLRDALVKEVFST